MHQIDLMKDYSGHFQLSLLSNGSLLSESNYFDIFFTWVKIVRDYSGSIKYELEQKENPSGNYQKFRIMVFIAYHLRGQSFMKKMDKKDLRN
jgi:hypothetical protein